MSAPPIRTSSSSGGRSVKDADLEIDEKTKEEMKDRIEAEMRSVVEKEREEMNAKLDREQDAGEREIIKSNFDASMKTYVRLASERLRDAIEQEKLRRKRARTGWRDPQGGSGNLIEEQQAILDQIKRNKVAGEGSSPVSLRDHAREQELNGRRSTQDDAFDDLSNHQTGSHGFGPISSSVGSSGMPSSFRGGGYVDPYGVLDEDFIRPAGNHAGVSRKQSTGSMSSMRSRHDVWYPGASPQEITSRTVGFATSPPSSIPARAGSSNGAAKSALTTSLSSSLSPPIPPAPPPPVSNLARRDSTASNASSRSGISSGPRALGRRDSDGRNFSPASYIPNSPLPPASPYTHSPSPSAAYASGSSSQPGFSPVKRDYASSEFRSGLSNTAPRNRPPPRMLSPPPPPAAPPISHLDYRQSIDAVDEEILDQQHSADQRATWSSGKGKEVYRDVEPTLPSRMRHRSSASDFSSRRPIPIASPASPEYPPTPDSYRNQSSSYGLRQLAFEERDRSGIPIPPAADEQVVDWPKSSPVVSIGRAMGRKPSFNIEERARNPSLSPVTRPWFNGPPPVRRSSISSHRSGRSSRSQSTRPEIAPRPAATEEWSAMPTYEEVSHDGSDYSDFEGDWESVFEFDMSLRQREEEAQRREQELQKKEEEIKQKEEDTKRKEERVRLQEEEARRKEDITRQKEEEIRRKEEIAWRKEIEAKQKEEEALRREEETERKEEELKRMEEDARRLEEGAKRMEEDARKKEEDARKLEDDARRKEEDARRMEDEARRKELEATRLETSIKKMQEETKRRWGELKRKEEDARRKEEEAKKKEEEARRREEDARRKEEDARRKEEDARRKEEDARRREENARERAEEAKDRADEARQQLAEAKSREAMLLGKEEEFRLREEMLRRREEDLAQREAESKKRDKKRSEDMAESRRRQEKRSEEAETKRRQEEERQSEEYINNLAREHKFQLEELVADQQRIAAELAEQKEARRVAEELAERLQQEERQKAEALAQHEEILRAQVLVQEEEQRKREAIAEERRQAEATAREEKRKAAEEEKRKAEAISQQEELRRQDQQAEIRQQERQAELLRQQQEREAQFLRQQEVGRQQEELRKQREAARREEEQRRQEFTRQQQEDQRRRTEERKRQNSAGSGSDNLRTGTPYSSASQPGHPHPASSRYSSESNSSNTSSTWSNASGWSAKSATSASSQASGTSNTPTPKASTNWRTAGASPYGSATPDPSAARQSTDDDHEKAWRERQEEQARKQAEAFQREQERMERQRQARSGKVMSKEEVIQLFEEHEKMWQRIPTLDMLSWSSFAWPMLKRPNTPEDLTTTAISAYVLNPNYPTDKSDKDRIKEHIRRWHPDRFETKLLPKVRSDERETVQEGAGYVVRSLNELLTRSSSSLF